MLNILPDDERVFRVKKGWERVRKSVIGRNTSIINYYFI